MQKKQRNRRSNYQHPLDHRKSKRVPEKYLLLLYWLCQNLSLCESQQTLENSSRDGIPDYLTCLLRNLYVDQEATVRTWHGTTNSFQIGKWLCQSCILSSCLFNLYAEHIMRNAGLAEAQAGIKISWRNINKLRYADDTTLMAESKEQLKSLLMEVKEESEKAGLKLNIQKTKTMAPSPITSWQIDGKIVRDFILGGIQNHCRWWLQPWNSKTLAPWNKSYDQPRQHIKKQRDYFVNKDLSSQNYDSHVWMWELDYKESWAPKNWCFWTVTLEKTVESPLDPLIQPVHHKGN